MAEPLQVGSLRPLSPASRARVEAVDERIRLQELDEEISLWLRNLGPVADTEAAERELARLLSSVEVLYTLTEANLTFPQEGPLRWVQLGIAGAEKMLRYNVPPDVVITNVRGIADTPSAEWILAFLLMHAKGMPDTLAYQRRRIWQKDPPTMLRGATVGIVGLGAIGGETARLCKVFGTRVIATKWSARPGDRAEHCDRLYPADQLHTLLGEADYVVLAVPLTAETQGLMGAAEFAAMKADGVLVNVARGAVIDWEAMREALRAGQIGAVYTDVTVPEPLPDGDPVWDTPNLIITPHNSGNFPNYFEDAVDVFVENLRRYLVGEPLLHLVDRQRGY